MTNNKQQTEINAVEYLDKVNQFAKENNTDKPKEQTAVEWLESQLLKQKSILKNHFEEGKWNDDRCDEIDNCLLFIQQAKEMEKNMLTDAYHDGKSNGMDISHPLSMTKEISADEWYNENFRGGEQ